MLYTALSKMSVPYSPRPCRKMDSSRHLWRDFTRLGCPGTKKLSIPNCFNIVSSTFRSPVGFQSFLLTGVPSEQTVTAPNRHLQTDSDSSKQTLPNGEWHLQTNTSKRTVTPPNRQCRVQTDTSKRTVTPPNGQWHLQTDTSKQTLAQKSKENHPMPK